MAQVSRQRPILIIDGKPIRYRAASITPIARYSSLYLGVLEFIPLDVHLEGFEVSITHLDGTDSYLLKYKMEVSERFRTRRRVISLLE